MEFELWYLIAVPILFAAGWWLRGVDFKQHKKATQGIDEHYAKGLSLLLSDDPVKADKAIDLFIEVVRLDPETIELHHALGNLFRRRGQFDRAIRLHSFLVNRAELPEKERALGMFKSLNIDMKQRMKNMSKGTKEKVQLILVMSRRAKLYILDEPIGGVDPAARDYILNTIITNYDPEASVIISTHLISDIENVLDEVIFIKNGEKVLQKSVDAIREDEGKSIDALFREVFRC